MSQPSPSITVNIPLTLLDELWRWYAPRDLFAPRRGRASPLGQCFHAKICAVFPKAYKESLGSLNALKEVRTMVEHLSSVVNDGIASMEKELRHASRCYGMFSLPPHIVTTIMGLVTDATSDYAVRANRVKWAFLETPPFSTYATSDRALLRKWREVEATWEGSLPTMTTGRPLYDITTFNCTGVNYSTVQEIAGALQSLTKLENLRIDSHFLHKSMTDKTILHHGIQHGSVTLSFLKRLYLYEDSVFKAKPLCAIVDMLHLPSLTHIYMTRTVSSIFSDGYGDTFLTSFDEREFPSVTHFCINEIRGTIKNINLRMDLGRALLAFPALTSLTLGSCQSVIYSYDCLGHSRPPIRHLRLQWDVGMYCMDLSRCAKPEIVMGGREFDYQLDFYFEFEQLETIEVVTYCDRQFGEMIFENVYDRLNSPDVTVTWVTDSSILKDVF